MVFIEDIVGGLLAHQVEPDMERCPVVDRGGRQLVRTFGSARPVALCPCADSYLLCPMNDRHVPELFCIRFFTGVSLHTLQHHGRSLQESIAQSFPRIVFSRPCGSGPVRNAGMLLLH